MSESQEALDELSDVQLHDDGDIGVQQTPVTKMSGAGYDVVVDVDEEVSFHVLCFLIWRRAAEYQANTPSRSNPHKLLNWSISRVMH